MNSRLSKLVVILVVTLTSLVGLHLSLVVVVAAQPDGDMGSIPDTQLSIQQNSLPDKFPIITNTSTQWAGISGDCVVFRDDGGGVYLHNLTTSQTFTITAESDDPHKVVVSQGVVVWRSEREGAKGLWGYYNPTCSDAGIFGTEIISPFHIISRTNTHAPALSGQMLTFDTWAPKGAWYVAAITLGQVISNVAQSSHDPTDENILTPISYPYWQGYFTHTQRFSDVYWDNDYKIACWYDNGTGVEQIECNDLSHLDDPNPWTYRFTVTTSAWLPLMDFKGIIAVHRDLVIWTDGREAGLSGLDLYIADLDPDDDGILDTAKPEVFVLINFPWDQKYPDIWWPFAVWEDWRNNKQPDIYAYDLSLDSDEDGIPNWKDPNRYCLDPAEFPVTLDSTLQNTPELWNGTVVWEDGQHIYGADIQPVPFQPRQPIGGTSQEKAIYWLNKWTVAFTQVEDIPGYISPTGIITMTEMISRYKSFTQNGVEHVRRAWYPPFSGSYVVGFDYCYFGTPDQKRYLGRFGRGFIYDQGLALIARTMLAQPAEAGNIGSYMSGFQNSGQLTGTTPGSFGFSFNGQGYWGEKDNFYDMDYLRGGANGWLGYGYLFYTRHYSDMQFMDVITGIAEYLLSQQVLTETDPRYGLFKGGSGGWYENQTGEVEWSDEDIGWAAAEHNIDIYFFLRDLGRMTDEDRYITAANRLKENMGKLWDDDKGRLHQGMGPTGTLDTADALDAASWGAMYWTAVGDLEKAKRSLAYADAVFSNTVTVSNTVTAEPQITIWGYKPYTSTQNLVWSEGSLGVAMANLKLGRALTGAQGDAYIQKAKAIVEEMETMQELDPEGGLFYAAYQGGETADFPQAPSAAGALWLLMVQKAIEDESLGDTFWGTDSISTQFKVFLPIITKDF